MARKRYSSEEIIGYLREAEVLLSKESSVLILLHALLCYAKLHGVISIRLLHEPKDVGFFVFSISRANRGKFTALG